MNPQKPFKWRHFQSDFILLCVRWYLRYPLSYRDIEEMMQERGLRVDHATIYRWVLAYSPELNQRCRSHLRQTNDSWRVDETYIKVKGKSKYLYRAIDSNGHTIDFLLTENRDAPAATKFFLKAFGHSDSRKIRVINTDKDKAYPILIELDNGQLILFDYANPGNPQNDEDKRIDTASEIKAFLKERNRNNIDVVVFTHIDLDHIGGTSELFYLQHAQKYQSDDRIKIDNLWIPAAVILEEGTEDEARIVRAEACYRLRQGKGIRVFSRPKKLESWLNKQNPKLTLEERKHLITDAGKLVPGFSAAEEGVEFFVHSPFATRQNDNELIDRNGDCIVVQATFLFHSVETKVILTGDIHEEALDNIIKNTKRHQNEHRLEWDIYLVPHHCSVSIQVSKRD